MLDGIKAIIFDLDGTLMDSMLMWTDIDVEYLGRYGYDLPSDLQKEIEGMGFTETAHYFKKRFSIPESIEEMKAEWNRMAYDFYAKRVQPKPGAGRFLEEMKSRGIKMGIASSNSRELILAGLKKNNMEQYFDCICTSCEVAHGKPSPDIYLCAAKKLGVDPSDCLVFEDVPMGILAGQNAGMCVCAMEDAHASDQKEKIRTMAQFYINDYNEVLDGTYEKLDQN